MVNHFASLLGNLDLWAFESVSQKYELTFGGNSAIIAGGGTLAVQNYAAVAETKLLLPMIDRNYMKVTLPPALQRVYNMLFTTTASMFYKQFLIYSYLRAIAATDKADEIKREDSRISYNLDDMVDYFKFRKIVIGPSSNPNYSLLVYGKGVSDETSRDFSATYTVRQVLDTSTVLIYSDTQKLFYHPTLPPSKSDINMAVGISQSTANSLLSNPVAVGGTGLSFAIAGPKPGTPDFTHSPSKVWQFTVDSPINFNLLDKVKLLDTYSTTTDDMFAYEHSSCNQAYQNLWTMHYNPVYRLTGLLLAYVERVNLVWQKLAT
jgi:hypothetical protein